MKAIDTNVLVRLIARDDAEQYAIARSVIKGGDVLLLPTVVLETAWVLRSRYLMTRERIAHGLLTIIGQETVTTLSHDAVASAVESYATVGDLADLLHAALAVAAGADEFATFDRGFATPAGATLTLDILGAASPAKPRPAP